MLLFFICQKLNHSGKARWNWLLKFCWHQNGNGCQRNQLRVQDVLGSSILNVAVHYPSCDEKGLRLVSLLLVQVKNFSNDEIAIKSWNLNLYVLFLGWWSHRNSWVASLVLDDDTGLLPDCILHVVGLLVHVFHRPESQVTWLGELSVVLMHWLDFDLCQLPVLFCVFLVEQWDWKGVGSLPSVKHDLGVAWLWLFSSEGWGAILKYTFTVVRRTGGIGDLLNNVYKFLVSDRIIGVFLLNNKWFFRLLNNAVDMVLLYAEEPKLVV